MIRIGLIGDYNAAVSAHQAIPIALNLAGAALCMQVDFTWVATDQIRDHSAVSHFDGLWCVPASPYRRMEGALLAIRHAREHQRPFLGTCGGFQHAIIEYARSVMAWDDAEHAETAPQAARAVVSPLECSLVEVTDEIYLQSGSRIAQAYGRTEIVEGYRCRYGLNPKFQAELLGGSLKAVARDLGGEVRAVELTGHPFFVATLFQPERAALKEQVPPLVRAFLQAAGRGSISSRAAVQQLG